MEKGGGVGNRYKIVSTKALTTHMIPCHDKPCHKPWNGELGIVSINTHSMNEVTTSFRGKTRLKISTV